MCVDFYQKFLTQLYHMRFLIVIAVVIWTKPEGNTQICFQKNRLNCLCHFTNRAAHVCVDRLPFIQCVVCRGTVRQIKC